MEVFLYACGIGIREHSTGETMATQVSIGCYAATGHMIPAWEHFTA